MFSGISPRTGPEALANNQAQVANNVKLQSGELRPWRKATSIITTTDTAPILSIQKIFGPSGQTAWIDSRFDSNYVSGPLADTSDFRLYYTSSGFGPRKTNWALATSGARPYPTAYYEMGVPGPSTAPTLSASGGSAPTEVRSYVYTYINTFGAITEESAPSPAQTVTCNASGATVNVSGFVNPPAGNYNYTAIRIYRTVVGASTVTYQLVDTLNLVAHVLPASGTSVNGVAYATSTYPDTYTVSQLGASLVSTYYTPPPSTLQGLVEMPNGILAGFTGNQIWFCEPYQPHAWPSTYMLTTEYQIVALGVFGSSLFVGTTLFPYLITGNTPSSMSQEKLAIPQACVAKNSIAYDQWGVIYASPNGLVALGPGVQDVITTALYTRDEWQVITPTSLMSAMYNNIYIGLYNNGSYGGLALLRNDSPPLSNFPQHATAIYTEKSTGNVFVANPDDGFIYQLDADTVNNLQYTWQSKKFVMPEPTNFAAFKIKADFVYLNNQTAFQNQYNSIVASDQTLWNAGTTLGGDFNDVMLDTYYFNGSSMTPLPSQADVRSINVVLIADDVTISSTSVTSNEPVRIQANTKAYVWEVQIYGNVPVRTFAMATTIAELRNKPEGETYKTL